MKKLRIGTRNSKLALIQTSLVIDILKRQHPGISCEIVKIKTTGDIINNIPLENIGSSGLFIKEIESALLNHEIDLAVHSMKDVPTALPDGLKIGAILSREEPWDVVIGCHPGLKLSTLNKGAVIGSSSQRRKAQLLYNYPHLNIQSIRGNLDTRLKKVQKGNVDAIVLAYAGVKRMGWDNLITEIIDINICLPAVGQGAIGIELRENDHKTAELITVLNNTLTETAVEAERSFLKRLEGGCQVPIGALAVINGKNLILQGMVASPDGKTMFRGTKKGKLNKAEKIGMALAEELLQQGCGKILALIERECY
ncbi:MAG: hypothetical protein AVO34_11325 [Firmicutes bacterium ML8_F2]|nr:MAG: hypothetical protein AVO34_11325 [Firmicutes bacterium ML8_F2]